MGDMVIVRIRCNGLRNALILGYCRCGNRSKVGVSCVRLAVLVSAASNKV